MTITLPPDLERTLEAEARRRGTTTQALAVDVLRDRFAPGPETAPATDGGSLYDRIKDHIGAFDGPGDLSRDTGRQFGDIVEEKHERIRRKREQERRERT